MNKLVTLFAALVAVLALAVPALAGTAHVKVGDNFFKAKHITIGKGSSVVWKWTGKVFHNVTKTGGPGKNFHSSTKGSGTYKHKFTKKGTYKIVCTLHPGMEMTIKVK